MKKFFESILIFVAIAGMPLATVLLTNLVAEWNVDAEGFAFIQMVALFFGLIISAGYFTDNDK